MKVALPSMGRRRREVNLVEAAVELAGGVTAVSRKLGVTRQTVYNWIAAGHMLDVNFRQVIALSKLSGVPVEQLGKEPTSGSGWGIEITAPARISKGFWHFGHCSSGVSFLTEIYSTTTRD